MENLPEDLQRHILHLALMSELMDLHEAIARQEKLAHIGKQMLDALDHPQGFRG